MWYNECGPEGDVVLSSRVRLARNIKGIPFPARATEAQQEEVIRTCKEAAKNIDSTFGELTLIDLSGWKSMKNRRWQSAI